MTQSNPPKPSTTGFELIEKLLGEFRDTDKSATLDKWNREFQTRLTEFKAANTNPKMLKDVAAIEKAFATASKLLETIKPGKPKS